MSALATREPVLTRRDLPGRIETEEQLEELLSRPTQEVIDALSRVDGDVVVLGVAGKVGPTLACMVKRAAPGKRVVGVARFSDPTVRDRLRGWDVETVPCDLLDRRAVERLPPAANVIYMAGKKFGTDADKPFAWAMNTHVPALVADTFRDSRIVVFSTLCVYPFAPVADGGCREDEEPNPLGDYPNSCVGRERMFQFFSLRHGTRGVLARLNYAIDLRYGVLVDTALRVLRGEPIPLATGHANVIWQGDAIAQIVQSLGHCESPMLPINIGGPEAASIRYIARQFALRLQREPVFDGVETDSAWVNRCDRAQRLFGYPLVPLDCMLDWVADWVLRDMPLYGKPTRYEVRDGRF